MKKIVLSIVLFPFFVLFSFKAKSQAIDVQDSLALVDFYNSTNGPNWVNHSHWLTTDSIPSWYGVVARGGHVLVIDLSFNNLVGPLPASLANCTQLSFLRMDHNHLAGSIPAILGSIPSNPGSVPGYFLSFSFNDLSGSLAAFANPGPFNQLNIDHNRFTFTDLEVFSHLVTGVNGTVNMTPQADLPLLVNGNTLSIAAGGAFANNTYKWYKDSLLVATKFRDSTFTKTGPGIYSVAVTDAALPAGPTLYSISSVIAQDSLALVDLFTATNGSQWNDKTNWLSTTAPGGWNGVVVRGSRVVEIHLENNNLSGSLPTSFGDMTDLTNVELDKNQLSGPLPASISNITPLFIFSAGHNQLTGDLSCFAGLTNVAQLDVDNNSFSGDLPALVNSPFVGVINLSNNQFTGTIPANWSSIRFLSNLFLSGNQLTGSIPAFLGNYTSLFWLDLSHNQFTDTIPNALGSLPSLYTLNLSHNQLTGHIPDTLVHPQIASLFLGNNRLTGTIPPRLAKARMLQFEVQNNQLSGPLPIFDNFRNDFNISNNAFTYDGMQNLPAPISAFVPVYAPQADIPLRQKVDSLYVAAGGSPAAETFKLFKDGSLVATQSGDSVFIITGKGQYNLVTTNSAFPLLTLFSDTIGARAVLPTSTTTINQTITGTTPTDIDSGIFQLVTLTPDPGPNGVSGSVTALVTIDTAITAFNGQPYVKRHYDITPADNAATAQATVTLYFTQADFDSFNTYVNTHSLPIPLLPTNGTDNGNIRITQYHGAFTGTSLPANYSQGMTLITPSVTWDAANNWWTARFPVTGFSGFFLGTEAVPLPLTLLQFTGSIQGRTVNLQWTTTREVNTRQFIIERGGDNTPFQPIGSVVAKSTSTENTYTFQDGTALKGNNFYRLKMEDLDGNYKYSPVVMEKTDVISSGYLVYPNPAHSSASLLFTSGSPVRYAIKVSDQNGRMLTELTGTTLIGTNKVNIDLHALAAGMYTISIATDGAIQQSLQVTKE